jgi:hypothetical protein
MLSKSSGRPDLVLSPSFGGEDAVDNRRIIRGDQLALSVMQQGLSLSAQLLSWAGDPFHGLHH